MARLTCLVVGYSLIICSCLVHASPAFDFWGHLLKLSSGDLLVSRKRIHGRFERALVEDMLLGAFGLHFVEHVGGNFDQESIIA